MFADCQLYCGNCLLRKCCLEEEISCHFSANLGMISSVTTLSFLSNIVKSDGCPDNGKNATFSCLNCIGQGHNAYQMVIIMRCITTFFSFHDFPGKLKQPATQLYHSCY